MSDLENRMPDQQDPAPEGPAEPERPDRRTQRGRHLRRSLTATAMTVAVAMIAIGAVRIGFVNRGAAVVAPTSEPTPPLTTAPPTVTPTETPSISSPTGPVQAPASCSSLQGAPPKGRFSAVKGWIAYRSGCRIVAVDPAHPQDTLSLGPSLGADPIGWSRDGARLLLLGEPEDFVLWDEYGWTRRDSRDRLPAGSLRPERGRSQGPTHQ